MITIKQYKTNLLEHAQEQRRDEKFKTDIATLINDYFSPIPIWDRRAIAVKTLEMVKAAKEKE